MLVSYLYLLLRLLLAFSAVNQCVSQMLMYWPNTKALLTWFETNSPDRLAPAGARLAPAGAAVPALVGWSLRDLSFTYPSGGQPVIENLSLEVPPGRTLVIVGPSGTGKSTLLALMLGLLRPNRGRVELILGGGKPEPLEPRRAELLRGVGYVGPESFLIEGTIKDNLYYGLEHEPEPGEIAAALEKAECQFVNDLTRGLSHILTEQGQGLSAGQKQRLALARALLRRPQVLILDEATANLDVATESRLTETLSRLKGKMTLLIVTHRATLLPLADITLDLDERARAGVQN